MLRPRWPRFLVVAAVAGCTPSHAPHVVAVKVETGAARASDPQARRSTPGAPTAADLDARVEAMRLKAAGDAPFVILWTSSSLEAGETMRYFVDEGLHLLLVEHEWWSEGASGDGTYAYGDGTILCYRESTSGPQVFDPTLLSCGSTGGATTDGPQGELRALTPEEHSRGTSHAWEQIEKLRGVLPEPSHDDECSVVVQHAPVYVNDSTTFTPTVTLSIPRALCGRLEELEESLASARASHYPER